MVKTNDEKLCISEFIPANDIVQDELKEDNIQKIDCCKIKKPQYQLLEHEYRRKREKVVKNWSKLTNLMEEKEFDPLEPPPIAPPCLKRRKAMDATVSMEKHCKLSFNWCQKSKKQCKRSNGSPLQANSIPIDSKTPCPWSFLQLRR